MVEIVLAIGVVGGVDGVAFVLLGCSCGRCCLAGLAAILAICVLWCSLFAFVADMLLVSWL